MNIPQVKQQSNSTHASMILEYLLSTKNLNNIINLPLMPLVNGRHVALRAASDSVGVVHTLLGQTECEIFGLHDGDAIPLHKLGPSVATLLGNKGPKCLNVRRLTVEVVIQFLEEHVKGLVGTSLAGSTVRWSSMFWDWMGNWESKNKAYPMMKRFHLLPTSLGLQPLDHLISMKPSNNHNPALLSLLERLGIAFLHADLQERAISVLKSFILFRNVRHLPDLLDCLSLERIDSLPLNAAKLLLDFITENISTGSILNDEQRTKFRKLPIFPLLVPPNPTSKALKVTKVIGPIPTKGEVMGVCLLNLQLLPLLENVTYVDGSQIGLLKTINPSSSPLYDIDVLSLALEIFAAQDTRAQSAYIKYMVQYSDQLPPRLISTLRTTSFVTAGDGTLQKPSYLVDPQSDIASLFLKDDVHMPRMSSETVRTIAFNLGSLRILQNTLTTDIVMERIGFISSTKSSGARVIARNLLRVMHRSAFDCSGLEVRPDIRWLPTEQALMGSGGCLDGKSHCIELYDGVLAQLDKGLEISESLRTTLGWDKPLPVITLAKQLEHVLKHDDAYRKVRIILMELGSRRLSEDALGIIRISVADKTWVPVSGGKLEKIRYAVFMDAVPSVGFYKIAFNEDDHPGVCNLLLCMGCSRR